MAVRGWYPDPGGVPGLYRYFDGQTWTQQTTRDVQQPLPRTAASPGSRRRTGPWLAGAVVVLILVVVAATVIWRSNRSQVSDPPAPTSTVSGWDDSSPIATPTPTPSTSPSPETAPSAPVETASARPVACDLSHQNELGDQPQNGRVKGGPLSFKAIPGWGEPYRTGRFFFSRDSYVQSLRLPEKQPWAASAQVGVLEMENYPGSAKATEQLLQCLITSDFYTSVDVTVKQNDVKLTQVKAHPASQLDALLTFSHPDLETKGSKIRIIVVDSRPTTTYYFHAVPQERQDLVELTDAATDSLSID